MRTVRVGVCFVLAVVLLTSCGGNRPAQTAESVIQKKVEKPIGVALSPAAVTLDQGATHQFAATVSGSTNTAVVWSIYEGAVGGSISDQGLYTAPAAAGVFHVVAASAADPTKTAMAAATVNMVALSVSPATGDMELGAAQQFAATVTGSVNKNVIWSVREGAFGGSINTTGVYTAPATPGTYHVVAISAADSTRTAVVSVYVGTLAVSITPRGVGLLPGATRVFTASVLGSLDDRVTWAVQEGSPGGVITTEGVYTAPAKLGEYHVVATSVAHPSVFATAKVVVAGSGFTDTGTMTQARSGHTATLLKNGDVLVVGGGPDANTEVYDHTTGRFRAAANTQRQRDGHTATLLLDGRVLVTGGAYSDIHLDDASENTAELYDPATGQFVLTGVMNNRRAFHAATLLADGRVLFTGGLDFYSGNLATAELYDPTTGTFNPTSSMSQAHCGHTATLLPDGRVLVLGGWDAGSAEIYDPRTGLFSPAGSFLYSGHTATLLNDGHVLLTGGETWDANTNSGTSHDEAQIFNPTDGTFVSIEKLNDGRSYHTATLLPNGQVLVVGGWTQPWATATTTAELFDPASSTFLIAGSMSGSRAGHAATLLPDGRVLVTGGWSASGATLQSAEIYTQPH